MSNCYYCSLEGKSTSSVATCTQQGCGFHFCLPPHGGQCRCGCSAIICRRHLRDHSKLHGGIPTNCFPTFSVLCSSIALESAARMCDIDVPTHPQGSQLSQGIFEFLMRVTPGLDTIETAAAMGPWELRTAVEKARWNEAMPADSVAWRYFRLSRCIALAARHLGASWSLTEPIDLDFSRLQSGNVFGSGISTGAMEELAAHTQGRAPLGYDGALYRDLSDIGSPAEAILEVINSTSIPTRERDTAGWLLALEPTSASSESEPASASQ